ncbi:MAG TPA: transglycosylase domain-containing protein [Candidatus Dormibacteraeota bacterium]|nr:transglycosylase domain-containing protein [Candidatus Dormibacteraeota bacterium]
MGVLGGLLAVLVVGANVYAVSFMDSLPSVRNIDPSQWHADTFIQDRSGQLLADIGNNGDRRVNVTLDQISSKVQEGTISIEDRTFWSNPGFDSEAIIRTAANNFRSGSIAGGGSTITQQLAKQVFLTDPQNGIAAQTLDRKMKEVVLAYQLSQTYSKKQILELYLNVSYYGSQQYGVEAAAQTYFHKHAKDVDLAEAALLSGLPQSPDTYNPVQHFEAAKSRQKEVLDAMVRDGDVTARDAAVAYDEQLQINAPVPNYKVPRFIDYVRRELVALGFNPGQQQLTVKTTLDSGKQQLAEQVVSDNFKANLYRDKTGRLSSALVSMDPKTGQILTYVGSPDAKTDQFDFVSGTPVNPGSSVKPFTYGAAIRDGMITMDTPIVDGPTPYVVKQPGAPDYKVENYDLKAHGTLPAREAMANSLNIPAVKVELAESVPKVVDFYRQMGMRPISGDGSTDGPNTNYGPSLTLGGYPITLLQEVTALSAYADMGTYHPAEAILEVRDLKGHVLYQADPNRGVRQAVDPGVAYIMAAIMSDDNNRAKIFGLNTALHLPDRHAAAKTGTSESFHDGLTIGFTPDLATVVWIGETLDYKHFMVKGSDGVFVAAPAWHKFMEGALKGVPDKWYDVPANVVKQGNSYFLKGTTRIDRLQGDNPTPTPSASGAANGVPPDPGTGPRPVVDPRLCNLRIPIPGCPTPAPPVPGQTGN